MAVFSNDDPRVLGDPIQILGDDDFYDVLQVITLLIYFDTKLWIEKTNDLVDIETEI